MEHVHCASCEAHSADGHEHYQLFLLKTIIAGIVGTILFVINMFDLLPQINTSAGFYINACLALVTLAVMIYCGGHYYTGAVRAFRAHYANMDTLIALGTGTAWIYSCIILLFIKDFPVQQQVYFESTVMIIALVNLGMLIEMRAKNTTTEAITKLLNLQPKTAQVLRNDQTVTVAINELQVNDLIRVRPGEQIPVDGIVTDGSSAVNEAMLTGEAMQQVKTVGSMVTGGTINGTGSFVFKATSVGEDTVLAQIISLVQQAQNSKPPLARLADKIAALFVPGVLIFAILTALIWYNVGIEPVAVYMLITSMSIMVIACPCALGLAVPISVMIAVGKAAQYGVLIRDADALQEIGKVTTIVFDKTGTLTLGQPRVISVLPLPHADKKELISIASSLEAHSEHSFAGAIHHTAETMDLKNSKVTNFQAIPGLGIEGEIEGVHVAVGNASFMQAQLTPVDDLRAEAVQNAEYGQTLIYVSKNRKLLGGLCIADPIKPDAKDAIKKLLDLQIKVVMVSGDQHATCEAVAKRLGIKEIKAEVMPAEKANFINSLQIQGEKVAMIGDGINDSIALSQANVGIALGTGTDIAIESADITLMSKSLIGVSEAIIISRAADKNMRENLFYAFIYNVIGIPIAAGILYPLIGMLLSPMLAGVAMALSSVTVVMNANRLRLVDPTKIRDIPKQNGEKEK